MYRVPATYRYWYAIESSRHVVVLPYTLLPGKLRGTADSISVVRAEGGRFGPIRLVIIHAMLCLSLPVVPNVQAELSSTDVNESAKMKLENAGFADVPCTTVLFTFHPNFASEYLITVGNWDEARRLSVRTVLHEARENFHRHPRPW